MSTKADRAEAAADARADAKADAKADAADERAADRAEAKAAAAAPVAQTQGYVTMEGGQVKKVDEKFLEVVVESDFISHDRKALSKGDRVKLPTSLARAMLLIGNARELTEEELEAKKAPPLEPIPAETIETRDPSPTTRDPRVRKR